MFPGHTDGPGLAQGDGLCQGAVWVLWWKSDGNGKRFLQSLSQKVLNPQVWNLRFWPHQRLCETGTRVLVKEWGGGYRQARTTGCRVRALLALSGNATLSSFHGQWYVCHQALQVPGMVSNGIHSKLQLSSLRDSLTWHALLSWVGADPL